jgi:3',5'-cyclic AMP phosphodiesterase CpdA
VKIGILSDIHVDLNRTERGDVTAAICQTLEKEDIDLFICAGDVADDFQRTMETIEDIRTRSLRRCLFVPGNHDIWVEYHPEMNSRQIYEILQQLPDNLSNRPIPLTDEWIAIGDLGWYDYSFGGTEYSKEEFDRMRFGDRVWQDGIKAVWNRDTVEQHRHFYGQADYLRHPRSAHSGFHSAPTDRGMELSQCLSGQRRIRRSGRAARQCQIRYFRARTLSQESKDR